MSSASADAWRRRNPEKARKHAETSRAKNRDKLLAQSKKKNAERYAKHRAMIDEIKMSCGCIDCGYRANPVALQFDHVRGKKLFGISASLIRSTQMLLAEIDKCEVRCANCHAIVTAERRLAAIQGEPMPEMNLTFDIPEIRIQITAIEYVCGQIKGVVERTNQAKWSSESPTKNWDREVFETIEHAQEHTVSMIRQAATKKAAVAALNEQLQMTLDPPTPPPPFPSVVDDEAEVAGR